MAKQGICPCMEVQHRPAAPPKQAKITSCVQFELLFFQILPVIFFQACSWDLHLLLSPLAFIPQLPPCSRGKSVGRQERSLFPTSPPTVMAGAHSSAGDAGSRCSTAQHGVGMPDMQRMVSHPCVMAARGQSPHIPSNLNAQSESKGKSTGKQALLTGRWKTGS